MKSTYLNILAVVLLILSSSCNTIKMAEKQNIAKSVDIILPYNLILKTPTVDVKQLKYDAFLNVLKKLNNVNDYYDNCEITKYETEQWNNINKIAKENISLLNYNDKDFKVLRAVSVETIRSPHTAFSELDKEKDLYNPFVYLEVEYIDKSKGVINVMYKSQNIYYLKYTETLAEDRDHPNSNPHSLITIIFYYPNGNVKSYSTKSSFYNYKIGMECEYKDDGTIIKGVNNENFFNSNLNDITDVVNSYYGNHQESYEEATILSSWNQHINYVNNIYRYQKTNYGKVWKINAREDKILIDDLTKSIIAINNFIEISDKDYFQKYGNKDFKEVEKELTTKVLITKDVE